MHPRPRRRRQVLSLAVQVLLCAAMQYATLRLHPRLLAACCLFLAVRNGPWPSNHWEEMPAAAAAGYSRETIVGYVHSTFGFLHGQEVQCAALVEEEFSTTLEVLS